MLKPARDPCGSAERAGVQPVRVSAQALSFRYFPMQKLEKIRESNSSLVNSPVISASAF